jgi:FKBP-type peptidyl-prolyl cis-trans isomerase (trigger factor)
MVAQKVGEGTLLEEAAEIALSEEYPEILNEHNIDAIGRPEIQITKIGIGSPMEFKIKTSLTPLVTLADYKKEAKKVAVADVEPTVDEKEVADVIKNIQQSIAHQQMHQSAGLDEHTHTHREITDADLPVVDDAFAKMVGAESVEDLHIKIKANIVQEKKLKEKDKQRVALLEGIIGASTIDLPKIIIDGESEKMLAQFKDDIARSGVSYEEYLKHIKKTEDDLKSEWRETAVKRAKSQVILNEIAKAEGIAPAEDDVKKEMEHILSHHKDADRFRVRMYVETFMTNELVFKFLEGVQTK